MRAVFSIKHLLHGLFLSCSFFIISCSIDIPKPEETSPKRIDISDQATLDCAREAWYILANSQQKKYWPQAQRQYNEALRILIQRLRYDFYHYTEKVEFSSHLPYDIARDYGVQLTTGGVYADIIPCSEIKKSGIQDYYAHSGIGIPLAAWVKPSISKQLSYSEIVKDVGNIHAITAYISFPKNKKSSERPVIHLPLRLNNEEILIGKQRFRLAADFSSPLALNSQLSEADEKKFLGLFRPDKISSRAGLVFQEPFNPHKIPVIFTHGLMSSPQTFTDLINRLQQNEKIRKHYQFWCYGYPTGMPWLRTSTKYREAIQQAFLRFDPQGLNKNLKKMVVLGHSMGGLITRYSISNEPWKITFPSVKEDKRYIMDPKNIQQHLSGNEYNTIKNHIYFTPDSHIKRAIFLATPHKGAPFADNWISALGSWLITLPTTIISETYKTLTLRSDMLLLNPEKQIKELTSIRQLSPSSTSIQGLNLLSSKVPSHSIIGDQGKGGTPNSSDGIVPYYSSHLDWSKSELIVPTGHSVQDIPQTAHEVERILLLHLKNS